MTDKRKLEILDKLLGWISEHNNEFIACAVNAADLTNEEVKELELCYDDGQLRTFLGGVWNHLLKPASI